MVGIAAHIKAASPGGPRYDAAQSEISRKSITNGIWLCSNCAKNVDDDPEQFTSELLVAIKAEAEKRAQQELALPPIEHKAGIDWTRVQSSKISSVTIPFKLKESDEESTLEERTQHYSDAMGQLIFWSFSHTCMATEFDDFCFVLDCQRNDRENDPGYAAFTLSVHCHITVFTWAFERLAEHFIEGKEPPSLLSLPGEQAVELQTQLGKCIPHRICRTGASSALIQAQPSQRIGLDGPVTTSILMRVLAAGVNGKILLWDDADLCPNYQQVLSAFAKINDADGFSWSDFEIDRGNPETWKYVGPN